MPANWYKSNPNYPGYPYAPGLLVGRPIKDKKRTSNNRTGTARDWKITMSARGEMVPIVYGEVQIGALIFAVGATTSYVYLGCIWASGECEEVVDIFVDDKRLATTEYTTYLGTTTQVVDPTLQSLITDYNDDLIATINGEQIGVCYSVVRIPYNNSFNKIFAQIKGRKIYDPRTGLVEYSTNPSLALADLITSQGLGMGSAVDWNAFATCADANDEIIGGYKRREVNIAITKPDFVTKHIETLRTYAALYLDFTGDKIYAIPDRPITVHDDVRRYFSDSNGDILDGKINFKKAKSSNLPTVVSATYTHRYDSTDADLDEWEDDVIYIESPKISTGEVTWKESKLSLPGYQRKDQAHREAVEYYNSLHNEDLSVDFIVFDEAIDVSIGDVISISTDFGISDKLFRITDIRSISPGRWQIIGKEYQENTYSDEIATNPDSGDTSLPPPSEVPTPTNLVATERTYRAVDGSFATMIQISWDDVNYPYNYTFECAVNFIDVSPNVEVLALMTANTSTATSALQEIGQYEVKVRTIGEGSASDWVATTIQILGKTIPPGDVPSITGYELGGEVRLFWEKADNPTDPGTPDPDIWRYEVRYGLTTDTWGTATVIDVIDALRLTTKSIAEGTWRFFVKAIDSINQYSNNAAYIDFYVSKDAEAFLVDRYSFTSPTYTNVHHFNLTRFDSYERYVTDSGEAAASIFTTTPLDTNYPNIAATYQDNSTSEWLSETWDAGLLLSGNWNSRLSIDVLSGNPSVFLELSSDGTAWDQYSTGSAKTTARYARIRVTGTADDCYLIKVPEAIVQIDAIPNSEHGSRTSKAERYCLSFDGVDDYIQPANHDAINSDATGYTAKTWIVEFVTGTDVTVTQTIYEQGDTTNGLNVFIDNGKINVGIWTSSSGYWHSHDIDAGTYYKVIARFDGDNNSFDVYLNGVFIGNSTTSFSNLAQHTGSIGIGATRSSTRYSNSSSFSGDGDYFEGKIFSVRQYNRVCTDAEIKEFSEGIYTDTTDLVQQYDFTIGSGITADDTSPTNNDATINGATWVQSAYPDVVVLDNGYSKVTGISITPLGSSQLSYAIDAILTGTPSSFLVYIFNSTGAGIANDYLYEFNGV